MTEPELRVRVAEPADSDEYPWVEDLDGVWHRRPPGEPWVMDREDRANALTVCERWVRSVRVSSWQPDSDEDVLCADCEGRRA